MNKFFIVFSIYLIPNLLFAQVEWLHQIGSNQGYDNAEQHIIDGDGNIIAIGFFEGSVRFGNHVLSSMESSDIFIYKTTSEGAVIWASVLSSPSHTGDSGLSVDSLGNIYIAGGFIQELVYESETILQGNNHWNSFLCKLNKQGKLVWVKGIINQDNLSEVRVMGNISTNAAGEIILAANFSGHIKLESMFFTNNSSPGNNLIIARYSHDGQLKWAIQPASDSNVEVKDIYIDDAEDIYLTGFYTSNITLGSKPLITQNPGYGEVFIAKLKPDGSESWSRAINKDEPAQANNEGAAIAIDPHSNDVYLAGNFKGILQVDGVVIKGDETSEDPPASDIFIASFSQNGILNAIKRYGTKGHDLARDIIIQDSLISISGCWDFKPFIKSFDYAGMEKSSFHMDMQGFGLAASLSQASTNEYYLSGLLSGTYDYGKNTLSTGGVDAYLLKTNNDCIYVSAPEQAVLATSCSRISITNHNGIDRIAWFRNNEELVSVTTPEMMDPIDGTYRVGFENSCGVSISEPTKYIKDQFSPSTPEVSYDCHQITVINQKENRISWYLNGQKLKGNDPEIKLSGVGEYILQFSNGCGTSIASIPINSYAPAEGYAICNVITPNGDDFNEFFELHPALKGSSLQIFNRWGKLVYESSAYQNTWNGHDLSSATYYWYLKNGCAGVLKGTLDIIR